MIPGIPLPVIAAFISAAIGAAGAWTVQSWRLGEQIANLKTEYATAQFQALEKAHAETIRLQTQADQAAKQHASRQAKMADAVRLAGIERDGLRDELTASRSQLPDASCTSVRQYASTLSAVFGECSVEIEGLARPAQGHAIDSLKLQESWPK